MIDDVLAEAYRRHMKGGGFTDQDIQDLIVDLNPSEAATKMAQLTKPVLQRDHLSRVHHEFLSRAIPLL